MRNFKELRAAIKTGTPLIWNDPDPIEGNDYTISYIEDIPEDIGRRDPILIQYNDGESEAQVFLHEILKK